MHLPFLTKQLVFFYEDVPEMQIDVSNKKFEISFLIDYDA